jgi:hypothetical protein
MFQELLDLCLITLFVRCFLPDLIDDDYSCKVKPVGKPF